MAKRDNGGLTVSIRMCELSEMADVPVRLAVRNDMRTRFPSMQCPQNARVDFRVRTGDQSHLRVECCGVGKAMQCGIWKSNTGVGKAGAQKLGGQGTDAWSQEASGVWHGGDKT